MSKKWDPDAMLACMPAACVCLERRDGHLAQGAEALTAIARVGQDNVSDEAKALVGRVRAMTDEMRAEIAAKLDTVSRAARIQAEIERNARSH